MKKLSAVLVVLLLLSLNASLLAQDEDEEEYVEKDLLEVAFFGGTTAPVTLGELGDPVGAFWDPTNGLADWKCVNEYGETELGVTTGFNIGLDVGYFLTANLVLGLNFTYSQFGVDSDSLEVKSSHHRFYNTSMYLKYYFFGESNLVPYLKLHAGVDQLKFTTRVFDRNLGPSSGEYEYRELSYDPAFGVGFGGGMFYYTHDYGGLYAEINYHHGFTNDIKSKYEGYEYSFGETSPSLDLHIGLKVFFGSE